MWIFDLWRWRVTRRRVANEARRLLDEHGIRAFFRAHEKAWSAQGEGRDREARFHREVCYAISRHLQRRAVLEALFSPKAARSYDSGTAASHRAGGAEAGPQSGRDTMQAVHARLLRDFA
jgi:hypothetical protein